VSVCIFEIYKTQIWIIVKYCNWKSIRTKFFKRYLLFNLLIKDILICLFLWNIVNKNRIDCRKVNSYNIWDIEK